MKKHRDAVRKEWQHLNRNSIQRTILKEAKKEGYKDGETRRWKKQGTKGKRRTGCRET